MKKDKQSGESMLLRFQRRTWLKANIFFVILFSIIILSIMGAIGIVLFHPTLRKAVIALIEALLYVPPVACGFYFNSVLKILIFRGAEGQE